MDTYISKVEAADAKLNLEHKQDKKGRTTMEKNKVENKGEEQHNPNLLQ